MSKPPTAPRRGARPLPKPPDGTNIISNTNLNLQAPDASPGLDENASNSPVSPVSPALPASLLPPLTGKWATELCVLRDLGFSNNQRAETALRLADGDIEGAVEILMRDVPIPMPLSPEAASPVSEGVSDVSLPSPAYVNTDSLARRTDSKVSTMGSGGIVAGTTGTGTVIPTELGNGVHTDTGIGNVAKEPSYETELRVLYNLGLVDRAKNIHVLVQTHGDVEKAVELLMADMTDDQFPEPTLSTDSPTSGLTQATIDEPPILRFATHLRVLHDLGFQDTANNLTLLLKHDGNIDTVLEELYVPDADDPAVLAASAGSRTNPLIEAAMGPEHEAGHVNASERGPTEEEKQMMVMQLRNMGFSDQARNARVLGAAGWDLERAVEALLVG